MMHEALHVLKSELFAKKIVCIGDVMMDRYVYGGTDRISPEAPIPVLKFNREHARAGGASNVAANLATLGAKVTLVSVVGNDPTASELHALLGSWPRIEREFFVDEARPTTEKSAFSEVLSNYSVSTKSRLHPFAWKPRNLCLPGRWQHSMRQM